MANGSDGSLKFDTKIDTEGADKGIRTLRGSLNSFLNSIKGLGSSFSNAFNNTSGADKASIKIQGLVDEIDQYKDALYYLERQGMYFGDEEYDEAYRKLAKLEGELNSYKKSLSTVETGEKNVASSSNKMARNVEKSDKTVKKASRNAEGFGNTLRLLKMSMMYMITFQAIGASINAVGEGFQNLVQYDAVANQSVSALMTALLRLKNSLATAFSPILTAIAPTLVTLINYLSAAITKIGEFFAALLLGQTTFTEAKTAQIDYAKSLENTTNKSKKAKDENKQLSDIDKLHNLTNTKNKKPDNSSVSGTPGMPNPKQMFEKVKISDDVIKAVDAFKKILKSLEKAAEPTIKAFGRLKKALEPFTKMVFDSLKNFYKDFLVPVGKWILGKGLPKLLDVLSKLVSAINWPKLTKALDNLFKALAPFVIGIGNGLIYFIQAMADMLTPVIAKTVDLLADALNALAKAISSIPESALTAIGGAIGGLATSILIYKGASSIPGIIKGLSGSLSALLGTIKSDPILLVAAAIGTLAGAFLALGQSQYDETDTAKYVKSLDGLISKIDAYNDSVKTFLQNLKDKKDDIKSQYGAIDILADKYFKLAGKQKLSNKEQALLKTYAKELINKIPELSKYIDDQTGAYKGTKEQIQGCIDKTEKYYALQAAQEDLIDIAKRQYEAQKKLKDAEDKYAETKQKLIDKQKDFNAAFKEISDSDNGNKYPVTDDMLGKEETLYEDVQNLKKALDETGDRIKQTKSSQDKLNSSWDYATGYIEKYSDGATTKLGDVKKAVKTTGDAFDDAKIAGKAKKVVKDVKNTFDNDGTAVLSVKGWLDRISGAVQNFKIPDLNFKLKLQMTGEDLSDPLGILKGKKVPKYATGTVVPKNYGSFLSILGDNTREPEVVSPISTMKQALKEVIAETGGMGGGQYTFVAQLNGKTLYEETVTQDKLHRKQTGMSQFAY